LTSDLGDGILAHQDKQQGTEQQQIGDGLWIQEIKDARSLNLNNHQLRRPFELRPTRYKILEPLIAYVSEEIVYQMETRVVA